MAKTKPSSPHVTGPLTVYAEGFRAELARLGYTPLTAAGHLRLMAHLSRWMADRNLDPSALDEATVEEYFAQRRAAGYTNERTAGALRPLLEYLRQLGVAPSPTPLEPATPLEALLAEYEAWMKLERGLSEKTVDLNVRLVRPFLVDRVVGGDNRELESLRPKDVMDFVLSQARQRPGSVKRIVTALRSLLRFLYLEGHIAQPLAAAVPGVPGWTLAGIPKALDDSQVAVLLGTCDRKTATGLRDLAILTLLVRLGLRAGEVAGLGLDDIDWRRGEIVVRGKANRVDRLPLPPDVGERIVDYLRYGRPGTLSDRRVFITAQAPRRGLASNGISTVVSVAGHRAGLGAVGAHRLRHSAATSMLRAGGSLSEIGQVLHHRRVLATAIYAKVDLGALRGLDRPWPGGSR
jgi:site-specific recombinase XerD